MVPVQLCSSVGTLLGWREPAGRTPVSSVLTFSRYARDCESQCLYSAGVPAASKLPRSHQFGIDMLMTRSEETGPTDSSRDCWVKAGHQAVHSKTSGLPALIPAAWANALAMWASALISAWELLPEYLFCLHLTDVPKGGLLPLCSVLCKLSTSLGAFSFALLQVRHFFCSIVSCFF